jgi:gag-polypeptide of LTR copia-type
MVKGSEPNLPELAVDSKPEHIAYHKKECTEWSNHDNQAIGLIQLRLIDNLYDKVGVTSYRTWKNLEESFGTPGPMIIHADFKKASSFKLTGGNPALEIAILFTLFAHLKANKAKLSEFYQVMLLIRALPAKWHLLASAYMYKNTKVEDYKFIDFCNAVCAEWERQSRKKVPHHADKLSAVKCKGGSPHFKD